MLALELRQEAERLRFYDPAPQGYLLSSKELEQQRKRAEELLKREQQRRKRAEERLQLTVTARRQAEARLHEAVARRQAEAARKRAEARIAELEAMLRERGGNDTPGR